MNYTSVKAFFEGLATDNGWGFAHNSEHLHTDINNNKNWKGKLILTMDEPRGTFRYAAEQWNDSPAYGFWLHRPVDQNDWAKEDEYYQASKTALETIIMAEINEQMENESGIWQYFDGVIDYRKSGPMLTERLFGIYVSIGTRDVVEL